MGNGLIAYLVAPLSGDGHEVRPDLFEPYIYRLLDSCELTGIACLANDFAYFSDNERRSIATAVVRSVQGRLPVDVCISAIATRQTIELGKHAQDVGAARVIVSPQHYLPLSDDEILNHYESVANALRIPIHVYNNPIATKIDMSVGLLKRIVDVTGARSIKEAGSRVEKFQQLHAQFGDKVALHVGFHYMALGGFSLGATAWDAGLMPSIAGHCYRLYRSAVMEKDLASARNIFFALLPVFEFFRERGALPSLKAIGARDGLELGGTRAPIQALRDHEIEELHRRIDHATQSVKGIHDGR
jgi:4-hydroxy-tetrahydrodipicolinate synthase